MSSKSAFCSAVSIAGSAAVVLALFTMSAAAESRDLTVSDPVSTEGLDLSQPAGARVLYQRLQAAAWEVCRPNARVALEPVADRKACTEQAIADAVRSARLPRLTQVYLENHTPAEAAAHGIEAPVKVAAK